VAVPSFIDRVVLELAAGNGGPGCASVHREKFKPLGGPDGGDGGRGGDIVLVVDARTTTLIELHRRPYRKAGSGGPGKGNNSDGADGEDLVLGVPPGTVVSVGGAQVADLVGHGTRHVVARGGHGGLGNAALASNLRKAPGFALLGEPGDVVTAILELKTVADVGLVGFPNAGKSSLVGALSAARPRVADYAFTTLIPSLGVVTADEVVFTVADVPGLIPGAATGRGLGHDFLRHIERCAALVHVLDCATYEAGRDPVSDFDVLEAELRAYGDATGSDLADRPRLVALNKIDSPEARDLAELVQPELAARGLRVFSISAASGEGIRALTFAMAELVAADRATAAVAVAPVVPTVLRPRRGDVGFAVTVEGPVQSRVYRVYRVHGVKPERWVRQTDFSNDEAVGYLAERLAKLGVEDALRKAGAQAGATVAIGADSDRGGPVVFDWAPNVPVDLGTVGGQVQRGPRGKDPRLDGYAADRGGEPGVDPVLDGGRDHEDGVAGTADDTDHPISDDPVSDDDSRVDGPTDRVAAAGNGAGSRVGADRDPVVERGPGPGEDPVDSPPRRSPVAHHDPDRARRSRA